MTNRKGGNEREKGRDGGGQRYLLKYFLMLPLFISLLPSHLTLKFFKGRLKKQNKTKKHFLLNNSVLVKYHKQVKIICSLGNSTNRYGTSKKN